LQFASPTSPSTGRTRIVAFLDLECPFCATYDGTMREIEKSLGDSVQFMIVPMPIPSHKCARGGAFALECALAQGRARQFISHVFSKLDSVGLKPWAVFAHESGVPDTSAFSLCTRSPAVAQKVDSAAAVARELNIPGTPTLLMDGWQFRGGRSTADLLKAVGAIRRGEKPT